MHDATCTAAEMRKREFLDLSEAAQGIAAAVVGMVRQFPHASRPLQKHYRTVLRWMARDLENFVRPGVSIAAQAKARELGLPDLRQFHWRDQTTKMKDPEREIFHWEHFVPASLIVRQLLALEDPSETAIAEIIRSAKIIWILKAEDELLTRSNRPDPAADYARAGIIVEF